MATTRPRIPIPTLKNPLGAFELAGQVLQKHQADGATSPIRGKLKTDLEAVTADITAGIADNAEAKTLERQLEVIYERRNNRAKRVQPLLGRVSKALQSEYGATDVHRLGDHGFTVDTTPRAPKVPKAPKP